MLFRRENSVSEVAAGAVYRRVHPDNMVETAKVLSVGQDCFGIPHVRFNVSFGRTNRTLFEDGPRVLALASFTEHYRERIDA